MDVGVLADPRAEHGVTAAVHRDRASAVFCQG